MYPKTTLTREMQSLDGIWHVHYVMKEAAGDPELATMIPADVEEVAVPASLNEQVSERAKYLHMGEVWYYRRFIVPVSWKEGCTAIRFGAVNYRCEVFVNGVSIATHETGYTPFEAFVPSFCAPGQEYLLAVRVDNKLSSETVPQGNIPPSVGGVASWRPGNLPDVHYDFFPYSGIHRPVMLINRPEKHLIQTCWTTQSTSSGECVVSAQFEWCGVIDHLVIAIHELGYTEMIEVGEASSISHDFRLPDIQPWSPNHPKLYEIDIRLLCGNECIDQYPLSFGFRTVEIKGREFLLNGNPVTMRGVGRHEDIAVIGKGLSLPFLVKDFNLMEWLGVNSFRTTHYPYSEEQLQMADRRGIMIIGETAANTVSMNAVNQDPAMKGRLLELHKQHVTEMIKRDYNHPCIVAWSLGNECEMMNHESQGYMSEVVRHTRTLDVSRPISMVSVTVDDVHELDAHEFDFIAANIYPSWYWAQGRLEVIRPWLTKYCDRLWEAYGKPILISEFGADALPGLHHQHALMWTEEYQVKMISEILDVADAHPACFGAHVWNFADYLVGQHTGRVVLNWKGVFTRDRNPKMAAHFLRERWTGKRTAEIDDCLGTGGPDHARLRYT